MVVLTVWGLPVAKVCRTNDVPPATLSIQIPLKVQRDSNDMVLWSISCNDKSSVSSIAITQQPTIHYTKLLVLVLARPSRLVQDEGHWLCPESAPAGKKGKTNLTQTCLGNRTNYIYLLHDIIDVYFSHILGHWIILHNNIENNIHII